MAAAASAHRGSDTKANSSSSPSQNPLFKENISPTLRTFSDEVATPSAHVRIPAAIKHQHREFEAHSHKIINSTNRDEQTRYQNLFTWKLARHMIGEELVVYPALVKHVEGGEALADKNRAEHHDLKEQLKVFQGLQSTDPRFVPTLKALLGDLEKHIQKVENQDFARLEAKISQEDSEVLA